jgi:hypothetical protein
VDASQNDVHRSAGILIDQVNFHEKNKEQVEQSTEFMRVNTTVTIRWTVDIGIAQQQSICEVGENP